MSGTVPLADVVDNLVHEPTQVHDHGVDLTVSAVYTVAEPGRLDFGGDELADASLEPVSTDPESPSDTFEWWTLDHGQYVVQYNEFLTGETPLFLQPHNDLLARGGSHPSVQVVSHLPLLPLSVPGGGLDLKENARISTLLPLDGVGVADDRADP